jgi:hypothetical protein
MSEEIESMKNVSMKKESLKPRVEMVVGGVVRFGFFEAWLRCPMIKGAPDVMKVETAPR